MGTQNPCATEYKTIYYTRQILLYKKGPSHENQRPMESFAHY